MTIEDTNPSPNSSPYVYAFIQFRSMDGYEIIEQAYEKYGNGRRRNCYKWTNYFCRCCFKKEAREIALREIDGTWPYP
jgi:hypothetical protein